MAPTDPRFLDLTVDDMLTDLLAHNYVDNPKAMETIVDENFDPDEVENILKENPGPAPDDWETL